MSNQEILERAIQKAIGGGWYSVSQKVKSAKVTGYRHEDDFDDELRLMNVVVQFDDGMGLSMKASQRELIFDHSFSKALWGEELPPRTAGFQYQNTSWHPLRTYQWHLAQMVISPDPIKYLGENINTKEHNGTSA